MYTLKLELDWFTAHNIIWSLEQTKAYMRKKLATKTYAGGRLRECLLRDLHNICRVQYELRRKTRIIARITTIAEQYKAVHG